MNVEALYPSGYQGKQEPKTKDGRVSQAIFAAIEEVNRQLPKAQQLERSLDTVLIGPSGKLDSLGLINLIVAIEQKIEEAFEVSITLTNEMMQSQDDSPFESVRNLIGYVYLLLERKYEGSADV